MLIINKQLNTTIIILSWIEENENNEISKNNTNEDDNDVPYDHSIHSMIIEQSNESVLEWKVELSSPTLAVSSSTPQPLHLLATSHHFV